MSDPAHAFIQGFLFSLTLCFDLGLVNMAIIKAGIERGAKPAFMIGFGSCFGDLLYLLLALFGVSVVFQIGWVKWLLWAVGSVTLTYLTFKMLKETWRPQTLSAGGAPAVDRSPGRDWLAGFGLAVASPTSIAWFALVAGPIVAGFELRGFALGWFVGGFFLAGLVWSLLLAVLSHLTGSVARRSVVRLFSLASAALFLYFAIQVFLGGLRDLF